MTFTGGYTRPLNRSSEIDVQYSCIFRAPKFTSFTDFEPLVKIETSKSACMHGQRVRCMSLVNLNW